MESVFSSIKKIRQLKSDQNIGTKQIENCLVLIIDNEEKFVFHLQCAKAISFLTKSNNIDFVYIDTGDSINNTIIFYSGNDNSLKMSNYIPIVDSQEVSSKKIGDIINGSKKYDSFVINNLTSCHFKNCPRDSSEP